MEHLSPETLARLVDEPPGSDAAGHLEACPACREELEGLREQKEALSLLPDLRPPRGGWARLERSLEAEGLLVAGGGEGRAPRRPGRPHRWFDGWPQAAAAVVLLLGGVGLGLGMSGLGAPSNRPAEGALGPGSAPGVSAAVLAALDEDAPASSLSLEEAEALVRVTEEWYRTALVRYRERLEADEGPGRTESNPMARFAALETLLMASRAAVRESPTDPFLNGLLVNMRAERDATLQVIRASGPGENWY